MKSSSALEALPLDTLSYALSFLSDKASLRAALISCPALYNAFKHREAYIASSVLFQSMDEGVYQEAVVAFNLKLETWSGAKACVEAINRFFEKERTIAAEHLAFPKVQSMWRLHRSIEYLANEIVRSVKAEHPTVKDFTDLQPTAADIYRVQRAFYRLDMYLTIFTTTHGSWLDDNGGKNRTLTKDEMEEAHWAHCLAGLEKHRVKKAFCSNFSIVEIEQLMCIRDMLMVHVAPVYNDFAEHDIAMGIYMPYYIRDTVGLPARALISLGLNFIFDFMTAPTRLKRSRVAKEGINRFPRPPVFELSPLEIDEQLAVDTHQLSGEDFDEGFSYYFEDVQRKAFHDDGDAGPEWAFEAWAESNKNEARLWGYVFWNLRTYEPEVRDKEADSKSFFDPYNYYHEWDPFEKWTDKAEELFNTSFDARISLRKQGKSGFFDFETFKLTHEESSSGDDDDDDDDDEYEDEDEEDEDESTDSVAYSEEE
ncbi:hypothetical protein NM208_g9136 [Fusarium decemcellulare]|uniref:Uncharacterized protein n=1 Tax=Fusarium decemcellulare TaxID=57161 RepID=A0ACC1S2N8_9HYPO|nr:hypothetical protein NM208_g9136 [Fusarium decemcellulare]